jgi:Abnormal spindle-like microcephaly-assoc'd, ASPM-SPD-2-Hydin
MAGFACEGKGSPVPLRVLACAAALIAGIYTGGCAGMVNPANASSNPGPAPQQGQAITATPATLSFGNVPVGTTNSQTVRLTNNTKGNVMVTSVSASGPGINTSGITLPAAVSAGGSASFTVNFTPASAGSASGTISVSDSGDHAPVAIHSSATGVADQVKLSASTANIDFPNVTVGSASSQTVVLTNTGNVDVKISNVSVSGSGFTLTGGGQMTMAPNQNATLQLSFTPTSAANAAGALSVFSNAPNSPLQITLAGSGVAASQHVVSLNWDPSTSTVIGYFVYRGSQSGGPYVKLNSSAEAQTDFKDSNLGAGQQYFYVVTAVDSSNVESVHSNEVQVAIPQN